MAKPLF